MVLSNCKMGMATPAAQAVGRVLGVAGRNSIGVVHVCMGETEAKRTEFGLIAPDRSPWRPIRTGEARKMRRTFPYNLERTFRRYYDYFRRD